MHLNILLSTIFLAALTAGLVIPPNTAPLRKLVLVDEPSDSVFKRGLGTHRGAFSAIHAAVKLHRHHSTKPPAPPPRPKPSRSATYPIAATAHKNTHGLPARTSTFHIPGVHNPGDPGAEKPSYTYTGKDVRKAVFDGHMQAEDEKHMSSAERKAAKPKLKKFKNYPHQVPKADGSGGSKPLPHMKVDASSGYPPGREYPIPIRDAKEQKDNPNPAPLSQLGPARVITQELKPGTHNFEGVVAHDQSRNVADPGGTDHFMVDEKKI